MSSEKLNLKKLEHRAVIKFLVKQGKSNQEIFDSMRNVYGDSSPGMTTVKDWAKRFRWGRESIEDDDRPGRPVEATTSDIVEKIEQAVDENRRIKLSEISERFKISKGTAFNIMHDKLGLSKVSARWVPKLLSHLQKKERINCCKQFLDMCKPKQQEVLERIVTGVHYFDPESKKESMEWLSKGSRAPKKARVQKSAGKIMATIFWDCKGILLIDYKESGTTINKEYYSNVLRSLRANIREKRRGMLSKGVLLLHDNAPVHKAATTQAVIGQCGFSEINHPPYSPDLAPSDYHLFPNLKKYLRGMRFEDDDAVKHAVNMYFSEQEENFFKTGIEMLIHRSQKCIEIKGDYIEK